MPAKRSAAAQAHALGGMARVRLAAIDPEHFI
jgi:hypothetical protein